MKEYWSKWTQCKNQPSLKGYILEDTEVHHLGYKTVIVDHYDKGRWDLSGTELRCVREYDKEEWNAIQEGKNNVLRLRNNEQNNS